jgi:hypothetical protein
MTIRTKRVAVAEPVAGNGFSGDDGDWSGHGTEGYHGPWVTDRGSWTGGSRTEGHGL